MLLHNASIQYVEKTSEVFLGSFRIWDQESYFAKIS